MVPGLHNLSRNSIQSEPRQRFKAATTSSAGAMLALGDGASIVSTPPESRLAITGAHDRRIHINCLATI
jgi:hypothetical protein